MAKQHLFNSLIFLVLVSFSFIGSLSHVFNLALIILIIFSFFNNNGTLAVDLKSASIFLALASPFFLIFIYTVLSGISWSSLNSLGPLYPIPIIGLLILLHKQANLSLSCKTLSLFSQFSILFLLLVYLFIYNSENPAIIEYATGDVEMFSGNPTPFSFAVLGISIFCLADWKNSDTLYRLFAITFYLIGIYFACFLSGSRGTSLAFALTVPFTVFFLSSKAFNALIILLTVTALIFAIWIAHTFGIFHSDYITKIEYGFKALFLSDTRDTSIVLRLDMWSAALKTVADAPFFGHGISERFKAVTPYLDSNFTLTFTHVHNDILTCSIIAGIFAGFLVIISILTPLLAGILSIEAKSEKLYFGAMLSIISICTANFSTVFFNDISAAWLAFSTYLVWQTNFIKKT